MKIALFGAYGSFDPYTIGGTESFARRVAAGLVSLGHQVDFVIYGAPVDGKENIGEGRDLYYFRNFKMALQTLSREYSHILSCYLHPRDRLYYVLFRRQHRFRIKVHQIYFSWPKSQLKRQASFLDARLWPFNGRILCISPRLYKYVRQWSSQAFLLLPPVPESYFLDLAAKGTDNKIYLTYIGRTEPAKGIKEIIDLFISVKDHQQVKARIYGYHHEHEKASVEIHKWLSKQNDISYYYTPYERYSQEVDDNLRVILQETDILVLPYRQVSSTIDTPLLLLEGMASLCAVLTCAVENIQDIYGPSEFLFSREKSLEDILTRVLKTPKLLAVERKRINRRNLELVFQSQEVSRSLLEAIL